MSHLPPVSFRTPGLWEVVKLFKLKEDAGGVLEEAVAVEPLVVKIGV